MEKLEKILKKSLRNENLKFSEFRILMLYTSILDAETRIEREKKLHLLLEALEEV